MRPKNRDCHSAFSHFLPALGSNLVCSLEMENKGNLASCLLVRMESEFLPQNTSKSFLLILTIALSALPVIKIPTVMY